MADINLDNVLNDSGSRAVVERYLDKKVLEQRTWDGVLANSQFGDTKPIPMKNGQFIKFTRKNRARRPETMASPSGAGSDPASGVELGVDQVLVPLEVIHEYSLISTLSQQTSWIDLKAWASDEMPLALKRRMHELVQNAFLMGRATPGVYASDGSTSTDFDQTAEATVTLYGQSFTFNSCPSYYANGKDQFDQLEPEDRVTWDDLRRARIRLSNAGAPKVNGTYICCLSEAMWNDLLDDLDNGKLTAAMAGGFQKAIKGLEMMTTFVYAGWTFVIDDQPFTMNADAENVRADYGPIHTAICMGRNCFGYMPLGGKTGARPKFKVQDITRTGYQFSIGYFMPWQTAILNPDWGCSIKGYVSEAQPNNFNPANPAKQLQGFEVSVS